VHARLRCVSDEHRLDDTGARKRSPEERFANAPFPLYGLPPDWKGGRFLGGVSWSWESPGRDNTTALTLVHGTVVDGLAAMPVVHPELLVETSVLADTGASGVLRILAECVWTGEAATVGGAWRILGERDEAYPDPYVDPLPIRDEIVISVDGVMIPFDLLSGRLAWVAQARVGSKRVTIEGHGFDIGDVRLVQVRDLSPYLEGSRLFPMRVGSCH
jgi:hypothetical protein